MFNEAPDCTHSSEIYVSPGSTVDYLVDCTDLEEGDLSGQVTVVDDEIELYGFTVYMSSTKLQIISNVVPDSLIY